MQTQNVTVDRVEARALYRQYKTHLHYSKPIDRECMRAYQLLAQGRLVIKALESIVVAGLNAQGLPKLAICRADATSCYWRPEWNGKSGVFSMEDRWESEHHHRRRIPLQWPDLPAKSANGIALVPAPPLHLMPQRALASYHILWEAEWTKIPPRDPFLLRRIGKADLWLVVAMWELTEVERAALSTRM